ncbi:hypothetical protein [Archangium lansingense]|uniref:Uncharacterized protein n=1 Tax=Archangium lansingense TaxID=2995310 RepID=A0ABT4AEF7_9BACT|nr:hypothetical protein [Archangium lansinium]MCY1079299.1 hypothetical protein [Archangium lansinium]
MARHEDSHTLARTAASPVVVSRGGARATDGAQYLVAWFDSSGTAILGTRVRKDGRILDPKGIVFFQVQPDTEEVEELDAPVVAFDGTHFLVAWTGRTRTTVIRVARDGTVVGPVDLGRFVAGEGPEGPALACAPTGRCLLVVSGSGPPPQPVVGTFIEDGVGTPQFRITLVEDPNEPAVAWTGIQFLVVWSELRSDLTTDLVGARVEADGPLLDSPPFVISDAPGHQRRADIARADGFAWVVWEDTRRGGSDIFGARVTEAGTVLDKEGFTLSTAPGEQLSPKVADAGDKSLVVWTDVRSDGRTRIRGTRLTDAGGVVNRLGFPVSEGGFPHEETPDIACAVGQCLVTFLGTHGFTPELFGLATRVTLREGALDSPPIVVSRAVPEQSTPAVAWGDGVYLAVWSEARDFRGPTVFAARIRGDGKVLDPGVITLPSGPSATEPAVAFDGHCFLVVWQEPRGEGFLRDEDIRGVRVSPEGRVLDGESIPISTTPGNQYNPTVTAGAGRFLVVWQDTRDSRPDFLLSSIFGARVTGGGKVLDKGGLRLSPPGTHHSPDVTYVGGHFLAVWESDGIVGARVDPDGTVPGGLFRLTSSIEDHAPAIASDGRAVLAVWQTSTAEVLGTRLTPEGAPLDSAPFPLGTGMTIPLWGTDVTFDGDNYQVAWQSTVFEGPHPSHYFVALTARVAPDGTVLDPGGVLVPKSAASPTPATSVAPVLAGDGGGHALLLRTQRVTVPEGEAFRINGRILDARKQLERERLRLQSWSWGRRSGSNRWGSPLPSELGNTRVRRAVRQRRARTPEVTAGRVSGEGETLVRVDQGHVHADGQQVHRVSMAPVILDGGLITPGRALIVTAEETQPVPLLSILLECQQPDGAALGRDEPDHMPLCRQRQRIASSNGSERLCRQQYRGEQQSAQEDHAVQVHPHRARARHREFSFRRRTPSKLATDEADGSLDDARTDMTVGRGHRSRTGGPVRREVSREGLEARLLAGEGRSGRRGSPMDSSARACCGHQAMRSSS